MMYSRFRPTVMVLFLAAASAAMAGPARPVPTKGLPPNTIDCADWTHNSDGSWSAHHNAKPFDLGSAKQITMQDTRIGHNSVSAGGYDVSTVLDEKCGSI